MALSPFLQSWTFLHLGRGSVVDYCAWRLVRLPQVAAALCLRTNHESKSHYEPLCDPRSAVSCRYRHTPHYRQRVWTPEGDRARRDRRATWRFRYRQCGFHGRGHEYAWGARTTSAARTPSGKPPGWTAGDCDRDPRQCPWRCGLSMGSDETECPDLPLL